MSRPDDHPVARSHLGGLRDGGHFERFRFEATGDAEHLKWSGIVEILHIREQQHPDEALIRLPTGHLLSVLLSGYEGVRVVTSVSTVDGRTSSTSRPNGGPVLLCRH